MSESTSAVSALDFNTLVASAERAFLLEGKDEILFSIRRRTGFSNFYDQLEKELRQQTLVTIAEYRNVKEEFVHLSRPSRLRISRDSLFEKYPHLHSLESEISDWRKLFVECDVQELLISLYSELTGNPLVTRQCLEVFSHLLSNRDSIRGSMARQIQHANSTKLIGQENLLLKIFSCWRKEPATWNEFFRYFGLLRRAAEFRFYAPTCLYDGSLLTNFHGLLAEKWMEKYDFSCLKGTLIVENIETFFSEVTQSKDHLIIWGAGWRAAVLRTMEASFPRPFIYWGDMDKEGYEIYGHLKSAISDLRSSLMGRESMMKYQKFAIHKEKFFGPYRSAGDLQQEYQEVCQKGLCIEQEKIHERPY